MKRWLPLSTILENAPQEFSTDDALSAMTISISDLECIRSRALKGDPGGFRMSYGKYSITMYQCVEQSTLESLTDEMGYLQY